ncbi:GntR family transcriptional regulator [Gottschalkiaceae bacterium SANA]|nr:GntR family transcriptional regulator [Gottschalkiaceae bacterium SANA]
MRKVQKENPIPLYYQLKDIILEMIDNMELQAGDPIPPERELCEIHGISRMTARKAIDVLVNEGVIYREQGRGSFVAEPKINQPISKLVGFTEDNKSRGKRTETRLLDFEVKPATKIYAQRLQIPEGSLIIKARRLRTSDGEPISIESIHVPKALFPDLTGEMIDNKSFYTLVEKQYGFTLAYAKQTIEPLIINDYDSELLNQEEKALGLLFRRTTFVKSGKIIEYTKTVYRSDRYRYEITLDR